MKKLLMTLLLVVCGNVYANYPTSFSNAKTKAEKEVYFDRSTTFYCQCDFVFDDIKDVDSDGNITETKIDPKACGYEPRNPVTKKGKENKRVSRIEWEHIMPANIIGGHLEQWENYKNHEECKDKKYKTRKCAYHLVPEFKRAHDDMNNLVPAVGELNGDRSNFRFANIEGENRAYGKCDFEIDFEADTAEPADNVKGNIGRVYLHMMKEHKVSLPEETVKMMKEWSDLDPVDAWECERNDRIKKSQGLGNSFVEAACEKR